MVASALATQSRPPGMATSNFAVWAPLRDCEAASGCGTSYDALVMNFLGRSFDSRSVLLASSSRSRRGRGWLVLAAVLSTRCRPTVAPQPTVAPPSANRAGAVATADAAVDAASAMVAAVVRRAPAQFPAPMVEPTVSTPRVARATPTARGNIVELLAIDRDRAVAFFFVGPPTAQSYVALVRRDGAIDWTQPLRGSLARSDRGAAIVRVGETVMVLTSTFGDRGEQYTLHGLSLADGASRFSQRVGDGGEPSITTAGDSLFVAIHEFGRGARPGRSKLTAANATGLRWTVGIDECPTPGYELVAVRDKLVFRTAGASDDAIVWRAVAQSDGRPAGQFAATPFACTDGTRWLVRTPTGLSEVDVDTMSARAVLADPVESATTRWTVEDCSFSGATPVVLLSRGRRRGLAAIDLTRRTVNAVVDLGNGSVGQSGFDPLPLQLSAPIALQTLSDDGEGELLVVDLAANKLGRYRSTVAMTGIGVAQHRTTPVIHSRRTVALIGRASGEPESIAVIDENDQFESNQVADDSLWLAPRGPHVLGQRAPRVVALRETTDAAMRDAVLAEIRVPTNGPGPGNRPCPDPMAVSRGDGAGVSATPLAPVRPGRLPSWDLPVLLETARSFACVDANAQARLVAWFIEQDERPLRNDNALIFIEQTSPPRFALVSLYRHATNREWNIASGPHSRAQPVAIFDRRPTRAEIENFLQQNNWSFRPSFGRILAGNVVDADWQSATGERPWRSFEPNIEQRD